MYILSEKMDLVTKITELLPQIHREKKFFFLEIEIMVLNDAELNGEQFSPQSTYIKCDSICMKNAFFMKFVTSRW